jgi:hypothetical protein
MPDNDPREGSIPERDPYTTPELTEHGSLEELTDGAGTKQTEKGSVNK